MPIADDCKTNGVADDAMFRDHNNESRMKYKCIVHKQSKIADLTAKVYPLDQRGTLHTALAFNFAGVLQRWKSKLWKYIKLYLRVYDWGTNGPGAEANAHREAVFEQYCQASASEQLTSPGAQRRL